MPIDNNPTLCNTVPATFVTGVIARRERDLCGTITHGFSRIGNSIQKETADNDMNSLLITMGIGLGLLGMEIGGEILSKKRELEGKVITVTDSTAELRRARDEALTTRAQRDATMREYRYGDYNTAYQNCLSVNGPFCSDSPQLRAAFNEAEAQLFHLIDLLDVAEQELQEAEVLLAETYSAGAAALQIISIKNAGDALKLAVRIGGIASLASSATFELLAATTKTDVATAFETARLACRYLSHDPNNGLYGCGFATGVPVPGQSRYCYLPHGGRGNKIGFKRSSALGQVHVFGGVRFNLHASVSYHQNAVLGRAVSTALSALLHVNSGAASLPYVHLCRAARDGGHLGTSDPGSQLSTCVSQLEGLASAHAVYYNTVPSGRLTNSAYLSDVVVLGDRTGAPGIVLVRSRVIDSGFTVADRARDLTRSYDFDGDVGAVGDVSDQTANTVSGVPASGTIELTIELGQFTTDSDINPHALTYLILRDAMDDVQNTAHWVLPYVISGVVQEMCHG